MHNTQFAKPLTLRCDNFVYFLLQPSYSQLKIFLLSPSTHSGSLTVESGCVCCTWTGEEEEEEEEEEMRESSPQSLSFLLANALGWMLTKGRSQKKHSKDLTFVKGHKESVMYLK